MLLCRIRIPEVHPGCATTVPSRRTGNWHQLRPETGGAVSVSSSQASLGPRRLKPLPKHTWAAVGQPMCVSPQVSGLQAEIVQNRLYHG